MSTNRGRRARRAPASLLAAALVVLVAACGEPEPTLTPSPPLTRSATPGVTTVAPTPSPTPTPLSLELPDARSTATIEFTVAPNIPAEETGELLVTVTNTSDDLIDEIVMRWPTELEETLYLFPFEPGPDRMVNPLVVEWTSWVEGPGSLGEPAGTTSLGWGPIDPGMTLEIPVLATRRAPGAIEFDLQFLEGVRGEGQFLLLTDDGEPAVTRVVVEP